MTPEGSRGDNVVVITGTDISNRLRKSRRIIFTFPLPTTVCTQLDPLDVMWRFSRERLIKFFQESHSCEIRWFNVTSVFHDTSLRILHLGWVDFNSNVPSSCLAAQPVLPNSPNSHLPKQNQADNGTWQNKSTQPRFTTTSVTPYTFSSLRNRTC